MNDRPPEDELAHHEAGHAVVSAVLGFPPDYVTLVQDGNAAGASGHAGGYKMVRAPGVMDQMTVSYAGYAAHIKYAPHAEERALAGARDDFERAERCMSVLPIDAGGTAPVVRHYQAEAAKQVDANWPAIQRVATALQAEKSIDSARLQELIGSPPPSTAG